MSDVDAVIELLEKWRDATGVGRLRIGVDATRVIGQLPPERKRALAIEVADRVAPQLVPAIRAEEGDLTTQQVGALVDLIRRADEQQLDDLVTALRTGEVGAAAGIIGDAVDVVAGPDEETDALLDDIATEDDEESLDEARIEDDTPARRRVSRATAGAAGAAGAADAATAAHADGEADGPTEIDAGVSVAAAAAAAAERDHVEVRPDGTLELDEEAVRERLAEEAAKRAQQYRDSSADGPRPPAYRAPAIDFTGGDDDFDFPDPSVERIAPIHERLARDDSARSTRRLAAQPVSEVVAAVTATPDGYRRRRAALRAVEAGRVAPEDVSAIVRSFDRETDRAWVAGAALDAGVLQAEDLGELPLSDPAVRRLERRVR